MGVVCSYVFDALAYLLAFQAAYEGSIPFARSRFSVQNLIYRQRRSLDAGDFAAKSHLCDYAPSNGGAISIRVG